jgi:hypothetical protein
MSLHSIHEAACSRFCRCRIPTDPPSAPLLCCRRVTTKALSRQRHGSMLRPGVTTKSIATKRSNEQMVWSRSWETTQQTVTELEEQAAEATTTANDNLPPRVYIYKCQLEEARSCSPHTSTSLSAPVAWLSIDDHVDTGPLRKNRPMHSWTASMFCSETSLRWFVGGQTIAAPDTSVEVSAPASWDMYLASPFPIPPIVP